MVDSIHQTCIRIFLGATTLAGATELWEASAPPKVKFFFWLALHEKLWTADRRRRHGLQPDTVCVLCDQGIETQDHLFGACVFTKEVWHRTLAVVGFQHLAPDGSATVSDWWLLSRRQVSWPFRAGFDSLVLLISWVIWKERNRRTFDDIRGLVPQVLLDIKNEGDEWLTVGYSRLSPFLALLS